MIIRTYKYKLYNNRNEKLHQTIDANGILYNYLISLHRRFYRRFKIKLSKYQIQKHITKKVKIANNNDETKYDYLLLLGSQTRQEMTERIDNAYNLYFSNLKKGIKASIPNFKKIKKYKSFSLKQTGYKFNEDENTIIIQQNKYKYFNSRRLKGKIKKITVKRNALNEIFIFITLEQEDSKIKLQSGKSVGYDFGMKTFLTASDYDDIYF